MAPEESRAANNQYKYKPFILYAIYKRFTVPCPLKIPGGRKMLALPFSVAGWPASFTEKIMGFV